jgi:hypothetical protein
MAALLLPVYRTNPLPRLSGTSFFVVPMRFPSYFRRSAFDLAIQQLRDGREGESGYGRRIALLLSIPAFDDPIARDVRRSATGELYVVRTVWNRALDMATARLTRDVRVPPGTAAIIGLNLTASRPPSLHSVRVDVDPQAIDSLLEGVVSATVTCCPQQSEPPLDATIFELTFGEELSETRYRWSVKTPAGWTPLVEFASQLIRLVDEPARVGAR